MFKKKLEILGHAGAVFCGEFHAPFLYSGSADHFATRWILEEGIQDAFAVNLNYSVYSLTFIDETRCVFGLSNGSIHIVDIAKRQEIKHFTQHTKGVFALSFNSSKNHFYSGDADGNLSVWDATKLRLLLYLPLNCGKIRKIKCNELGTMLVLSCQDGTFRVFETEGYNEIHTITAHEGGTSIAVFHPTKKNVIVTGGKDAHLKIWDFELEKCLLDIPAHNYVIYDLIFINDNQNFITCSRDKKIKCWNAENFDVVQRLDHKMGGHSFSVNALVKITENQFASMGDDKKIVLWESVD